MASKKSKRKKSVFEENGLKSAISFLTNEIKELYLADQIPWVVGYSGGKDSTATLQLVWLALSGLEPKKRTKPVYVISTDTLVENPVVSAWVANSLKTMKGSAEKSGMPIQPRQLTPEITDTFWVNLIGRGYPAPRHKFRWCTDRLKIYPSNAFITNVAQNHGEAILVLGTRKAESSQRASTMAKYEQGRVRERLSPSGSLTNCLIYSPIEDWTNDDVWLFLMQVKNQWGYNNKDLLTMYQGASPDGECPLVVDTSTPSCGDSRFGCWVCTMVDKDRSMHAMIQNDEEKEWMLPLLHLRNELDEPDDRKWRDFRRMDGRVQLFHDRPIHGPYKQERREYWFKKVLEAQCWIRENGPEHVKNIDLISMDEMNEIRRIWVVDKHELEDSLPGIYREVMGKPFPGNKIDDNLVFGADEIQILKDLCKNDSLHFELIRELIDIEKKYRSMARRSGLFDALESAFQRSYYTDQEDAVNRARKLRDELQRVREPVIR